MTVPFRLAAVSALALCGTAHAQSVPGDPAAVAEAPHFMAVTGKPALVDALVENLRLAAMAYLARGGMDYAAQASATEQLILPELRAQAASLLRQWTDIYASQVSADDMKVVETFYETPAGQRFLASQPAVATSLQVATLNWETAALKTAMTKHIDELRSRGYGQ